MDTKSMSVGFHFGSLSVEFPPFYCDNKTLAELLGGKWPKRADKIFDMVGITSRCVPPFTLDGFPDPAFVRYCEFELALNAARQSMRHSGYQPSDIGTIVYVSGTIGALRYEGRPMVLNNPALSLHRELNLLPEARAITVDQACSGFLETMIHYSEWLMSPQAKGHVLIVGSNGGWDLADRQLYDRARAAASFLVFGSGAVALILERGMKDSGLVEMRTTCRFTDSHPDQALISIWPDPDSGKQAFVIESRVVMNGYVPGILGVFRTLRGMRSETDIMTWYLAHQPNGVLFRSLVLAMQEEFGINESQMPSIVDWTGNISGVCVPATLWDMHQNDLLRSGQMISCAVIGHGGRSGIDLCMP